MPRELEDVQTFGGVGYRMPLMGGEKLFYVKGQLFLFKLDEAEFNLEFERLVDFLIPMLRAKAAREASKIIGYDFEDCYNEGLIVLLWCIRASEPHDPAYRGTRRTFLSNFHEWWWHYFESKIKLRQNRCRTFIRHKARVKRTKAKLARGEKLKNRERLTVLEAEIEKIKGALTPKSTNAVDFDFLSSSPNINWDRFLPSLDVDARYIADRVIEGYSRSRIKRQLGEARFKRARTELENNFHVQKAYAELRT